MMIPPIRFQRGDETDLPILGKKVSVSFLGQGTWTQAWRAVAGEHKGMVYLLVDYQDKTKDILLERKEPYLPYLHFIEDVGPELCYKIYRSPFYRPLSPDNKDPWQMYLLLREIWLQVERENPEPDHPKEWRDSFFSLLEQKGKLDLDSQLRKALLILKEKASLLGDHILFEFPIKNVGVDKNNKLILRDILFDPFLLGKQNIFWHPQADKIDPLDRAFKSQRTRARIVGETMRETRRKIRKVDPKQGYARRKERARVKLLAEEEKKNE